LSGVVLRSRQAGKSERLRRGVGFALGVGDVAGPIADLGANDERADRSIVGEPSERAAGGAAISGGVRPIDCHRTPLAGRVLIFELQAVAVEQRIDGLP
jgi:hypothetical protein